MAMCSLPVRPPTANGGRANTLPPSSAASRSGEPAEREGAQMRDDRDRPKAGQPGRRRAGAAGSAASPAAVVAPPGTLAELHAEPAWESYITVLVADAVEQAEFLVSRWPEVAFPRCAAQALIP